MKLIMSFMLIGFLALSCKKETRTEQSTSTDTIIADSMRTDKAANHQPMSSPLPSDTLNKDSTSSMNKKDTARAVPNTNRKK
ncbi:hypothetical protein [Chryseobacterium bernardetii]|uniref:hypothetical protein n=1 Tax=Chryseobacterium bernardetii TaxID=1241978 RepID=UPI003AF857B3